MCSWIGVHQQSAMWSCKEFLPDRKCWRLLQVSDLSAYTTATGTAAPSSTASAGGRPASTVGARKAAKRGRQKVPVAPLPANGKPAVAHLYQPLEYSASGLAHVRALPAAALAAMAFPGV